MAKKSIKGVENVYTQHSPLLAATLEAAVRGRLPPADYPAAKGVVEGTSGAFKVCEIGSWTLRSY